MIRGKRTGLILALSALGMAAPAEATWTRATSRHFIVYSDGPVDELSQTSRRLERFDEVLRARLHLPDDDGIKPLSVFMVKNQAAVAEAMGYSSNEYIFGYYSGRAEGNIAVTSRRGTQQGDSFDIKAESILFHEYTHHMMLQYFPGLYSTWYVEGLAELYSTVEFADGDKVVIGKPVLPRMFELRNPKILPSLDQMTRAKPGEVSFASYSKGWLLTHYLSFNQKYAGALPKYVAAREAGKNDRDALIGAVGIPLVRLDHEITAYFKTAMIPIITVSVPVTSSGRVKIEPVSAAEDALMEEQILYLSGAPEPQQKRLMARTRKQASLFPNDLFAQRLLAGTALTLKRYDEAETAIDAALAAAPTDPRALLIKGSISLARLQEAKSTDNAAWQAARSRIARANRADPDDALPLVVYFGSFAQQGLPPTPMASKGLARAVELAPQDDKVTLMLGEDYARQHDIAAAIRTVRPVAASAHGSPEAKRAIALLALWQAQSGSGTQPATP